MEVIALKGKHDTGKSHTLNIVYQLLLNDGYTQVSGHFKEFGNPAQEDFFDILEKNGRKVGFVTMGDYRTGHNRGVKNLLAELYELKCIKTICAFTSSKPGIGEDIEAYKNQYS